MCLSSEYHSILLAMNVTFNVSIDSNGKLPQGKSTGMPGHVQLAMLSQYYIQLA